ncbi:hypothetical protein B0H12DRAFT_356250 [Mycena haematopus]|nr:hypothetical protein B0H12DRAFT_356250 [Mycena haematopus]
MLAVFHIAKAVDEYEQVIDPTHEYSDGVAGSPSALQVLHLLLDTPRPRSSFKPQSMSLLLDRTPHTDIDGRSMSSVTGRLSLHNEGKVC